MTPRYDQSGQLHFKPDRRGARRSEAPPRRYHERLYGPCVATVRGVDAGGAAFTEATVLDNVSASGLFVKLQRDVAMGTRLFVVFAFSTVELENVPAPRVAAHGEVRRIEVLSDKAPSGDLQYTRGVGIEFRHHRFL